MKRLFITMWIVLLINSYYIKSQTLSSIDKWMEYVEEIASETEDEEKAETLYSELSYLSEHPFELNSVAEEELKKLPFLSDRQIENILFYRKRYGKMVSIYELKNVEAMDMQTIGLLLPFVYIDDITVEKRPITVKNLLKQGRNELQIRYDKCFQQKKGYSSYPDSVLQQYPNRKYLGEPFYHSLRYSYTFDERLQFGVVGEKDTGEPFWNMHHKGYDYYSVHLFLKDINRLKSLAIGDYKVSFGQGLVISNDFSPSRSAVVAQAERRTNGFRRHFSTNENDYFRGAAATVNINKVDVSFFYSYRKMDAGLDSFTFTSVKTDGMHRLVRDREKIRTIGMQTYGGNIRYSTPNLCIGLTALSYSFGKFRLEPDPKPYNLFYFKGNDNMNISVDYLLKNRTIKFYGETAICKNGSLAMLNALQLTPVSYLSFLLLHRYYDRRYQAYFGNAFAQGSSVQNEQGLYMGMQWVPMAHWKLSAYADFFRFPWLRYGVDTPSSGYEYMAQLDYTYSKNFSAYLRYKVKRKEKNNTGQRMRLQFLYSFASSLILRTSVDGILYDEKKEKQSVGFMVAQSMGWKPDSLPIQGDIYAAWFSTDDYDSRISSYEKNILYAFNMPSFYGRGIRVAMTFRWNMVDKLSLSVKWGHTYYSNREVIGTELEEIKGHHKTDIYALVRWKF